MTTAATTAAATLPFDPIIPVIISSPPRSFHRFAAAVASKRPDHLR
jgi:hypothetical protein